MSSVQLLETRGNASRWGRDDHFASTSRCKTKSSIAPVSASEPQFSLLEAAGVSVWSPKPLHGVWGSALHPGHLCTLGASTSQAWAQLGGRAGVQPPQPSRDTAGCLPGSRVRQLADVIASL